MAEESSSASSSGTVKVPGLGSMKRSHVLILVAVAVGVVGYAYWQKARNAEPVYLDPAELTYGEDIPAGTSTTAGLEYNNEYDDDPTFGAPRTNAEWAQRAQERLSYLNYDGQMVAVTIGKYLARQQLTAAEAELIRTIHGLIGRPPEGDYPILLGPNPPNPGETIPTTAPYNAGNHVLVWINNLNQQYSGLGLSQSKLVSLNPGIPIAKANSRGYISASNPIKPGDNVVDVFSAGGTAKIK